MSAFDDPSVGDILLVAYDFAPRGWALCNGQLLPVRQYSNLFSLIGNRYGGDGHNTFALPNLNGRVPIGQGMGDELTNRTLAESGGFETVTLTAQQIPIHDHSLSGDLKGAAGNATTTIAGGNSISTLNGLNAEGGELNLSSMATTPTAHTTMAANSVSSPKLDMQGESQPHNNMQPYLVMNYIIALIGTLPQRY